MDVNVLSNKDRKKSLSGQKKKKIKSKKAVLNDWDKVNITSANLDASNISKLIEALEDLLPQAKLIQLPSRENGRFIFEQQNEAEIGLDTKPKRHQLLLGVNVVSKGLEDDIADCVIFSDDITPKLMVYHLQVLCCSKNVPFVSLPNFRELTRKTLGFPCIVLGIKKNSEDFALIKELVWSSVVNGKFTEEDDPESDDDDDNDDDDDVIAQPGTSKENDDIAQPGTSKENDDIAQPGTSKENDTAQNGTEKEEKPFTYLHRDPRSRKRVFVPEDHDNDPKKMKDFITLHAEDAPSTSTGNNDHKKEKKMVMGDKNKKNVKDNSSSGKKFDFPVEYTMTRVLNLEGNPSREINKHKKYRKP